MNVFVNVIAAKSGGAITILNQFISSINKNDIGVEARYFIFVNKNLKYDDFDNVCFCYIENRNFLKRIYWDFYGLKKWSKKNNVKPDCIISFQNTGVFYRNIKQIIYFHQMLSLDFHRWNLFKRKERGLFFYRYLYPFYIKLFINKHVKFITQLESTRNALVGRFNVSKDNVFVIRPDVYLTSNDKINNAYFDDNKIHLLYVANSNVYKNHIAIVEAIGILSKKRDLSNILIHFTCDKDYTDRFVKRISSLGLDDTFIFEGVLSFDRITSLYNSVQILLYPSYIESFGLPLIEGASYGLPIICSDLLYARDVIRDYEGVTFVKVDDYYEWADAIDHCIENPRKSKCLLGSCESEWNKLFDLMFNEM